MESCTDVVRFYRENKIPIRFNSNENLEELKNTAERLRIIIVQRGSGIVNIDGSRLSIVAPAILCINEKEVIYIETKLDWDAKSVCFHPRYINSNLNFEKIREVEADEPTTNRQDIFLLRPFVRKNENYKGLLNVDPHTMNRISGFFDRARNEVEEQSHRTWSCCARSYFLELLFALMRVYETPESRVCDDITDSSVLVSDVISYISSNYHKKITVSQICSIFNTNKTTLQKQFKLATGQSVMAYLTVLRLKLAALMLKDTSITISQIADRLGFSDSTHFNKAFHKLTGYSPTQYRKEFRGEKEKLPI